MKKRLFILLIYVLIFSCGSFCIPTQALSKTVYVKYAIQQGNALLSGGGNSLGGYDYWKNKIESNQWNGNERPVPCMGDSNIDGKVNAIDALFALKHAVYGNALTAEAVSGARRPPVAGWHVELEDAYNRGSLVQLAQDKEVWIDYCRYNSAFFADVTKDCVVNAKDALEILKYSVGKAKDFPEGNFTTIFGRFCYWHWPTEFSPETYPDKFISITDQQFCEKYNFAWNVTPTDQ